jgi:lysophospholipase L1-like esterase
MRRLMVVAMLVALLATVLAPVAKADADSATHYYLSLGDSLAASYQPNGDFTHGYSEQLYETLAATDRKLELVKLGCGGESTTSMRFGSQLPGVVLSCGTPRYYNFLYSKGTQLAEAVSFLRAHKDKVALVTINIGSNDLSRFDPQFNVLSCLFEQGCDTQAAGIAQNLTAILSELRAAAGPDVSIVGMTYYNALAPLGDPALTARVAAVNGVLESTYAAADVPVADVAGAFHNDDPVLSAQLVCAWTWVCTLGDAHLNTAGYGVVADEFLKALQ